MIDQILDEFNQIIDESVSNIDLLLIKYRDVKDPSVQEVLISIRNWMKDLHQKSMSCLED